MESKTHLIVGHLADIGAARDHQEDAYAFQLNPTDPELSQRKGSIFIVADGIGGYQAGEIASRMAVRIIPEKYYSNPNDRVLESITEAMTFTNDAIYQSAQTPGREKMATTVVCAVIRENTLFIGYVGDSRAYLFRAGVLTRLTEDHSWMNEQVRLGNIAPEELTNHPQRNLITRSLGSKPQVIPEIKEIGPLQNDDRIILCTDGLTEHLNDEQIGQVLGQASPPRACQILVDLANAAGGTDNITVLIVEARVDSQTDIQPIEPHPSGTTLKETPAEVAATTDLDQVFKEKQREIEKRLVELNAGEERLHAEMAGHEEKLLAELSGRESKLRLAEESLQKERIELENSRKNLNEERQAYTQELEQFNTAIIQQMHKEEGAQKELDKHKQELLQWGDKLVQFRNSLLERQRQLALAETSLKEKLNAGNQIAIPLGANLVYQWEREFTYQGGGNNQEYNWQEDIQLSDHKITVGVTIPANRFVRKFPNAIEIWAEMDGQRTSRMMISYNRVKEMDPSIIAKLPLAVIVTRDEIINLRVGSILTYALIKECQFATVAEQRVFQENYLFKSVNLIFRIAVLH